MNIHEKILQDLFRDDIYNTLPSFLDRFNSLITHDIGLKPTEELLDGIDDDILNEISSLPTSEATLDFGKSLRDIKCVIVDAKGREHEVWLQYRGPKDLRATDASVPMPVSMENKGYKSISEAVNVFKRHVGNLKHYFNVLDAIQQYCTVMEPVTPTYKDKKRIVVLVDKVWLSVEVSLDGSATNIGLVGQYKKQHTQLEQLLKEWNHNEDVATNVRILRNSLNTSTILCATPEASEAPQQVPECAICLCVELPGYRKVPMPLCDNPNCGVYFHQLCLYECLINSRPATIGVAIGTCPACSQPIACSKADL